MANSKIEINFLTGFSTNTYIKFLANGVEVIETFKTSRLAPFQVSNVGDVRLNYKNAFVIDYNSGGDFILTIFDTSKLRIQSTSETVNFSDFETTTGATAEITNTYVPPAPPSVSTPQLAQVRSTYSLRIIPNLPFVYCDLALYFWIGDKNAPPTTPTYNLSKQVVTVNQTVCSFDINHLAKSYITNSIANYGLNGVQDVLPDSNVWVKYEASCDSDPTFEEEGLLLATYGYGYFEDGYNPLPTTKALITGNNFTIYKGKDYRVYFQTTGLVSIEVNRVAVAYTYDTDLSYEMIASINLKLYTGADVITLDLEYEDEYIETLTFNVKEECFYEVINCVFINKYGYPQSFFLSKVSKPSINIEGKDYRGLISNFGVYNTNSHQTVSFNVNGTNKIKCNTDFLNEVENDTIQEMLLSENIWLIENGITRPVVLETKTLDYKQTKVERLIQYEFTFNYAFNTINQV